MLLLRLLERRLFEECSSYYDSFESDFFRLPLLLPAFLTVFGFAEASLCVF